MHLDKEFYRGLKVANYNRKSTESDDRQALSISAQTEEAEKLAEKYGIQSKDMISYNEAKSAKIEGRRTQFIQMVKDIKSGKCNAIICWKLDRLARNMIEGGIIIDLLQKGTIKCIITGNKIFLPDENAILMGVEFGHANQFSRELSINVKRGQRKKARMGYPHGLAALGFKNDKTEEKGNRKWLVDESKFPLVQQLFEMYLTGEWSVNKLGIYARNVLKLTTPIHKKIGGGLVTLSRVHEMLRDPIYAGFFFYGGERYELQKDLPRVITEDQHEKIKRIMTSKNIPKAKNDVGTFTGHIMSPQGDFIGQDIKFQIICDCKHKFCYTNKTHCPKCKKEINSLSKPKYLEYTYYYNVSRKKKQLATNYLPERVVVNELVTYIKDNLELSVNFADWCKRHIEEMKDAEIQNNFQIEESNKMRISEIEKKKAKLRKLLADEIITSDEYKKDINELDALLPSYKCQSEIDWRERARTIIDLTQEAVNLLLGDKKEDKRMVLKKLGSNLIWDENKLEIISLNSINLLISGLSAAKRINPRFEPNKTLASKDKTEVFASVCPVLLRR